MALLTFTSNKPRGRYSRHRSHNYRPRGAKHAVKVAAPHNRAEDTVATKLNQLKIAWKYENREFPFRNGRGFKPDFWLPEYGIFLEVTNTDKPATLAIKRDKIARLANEWRLVAILISFKELQALANGQLDLRAMIEQAAATDLAA